MKITKRQLKRIIKEEKARLIQELDHSHSVGDYPRDSRDWFETLAQFIDQDLTSRGVWYEDEGREVIKALEQLRRYYADEMRGSTR